MPSVARVTLNRSGKRFNVERDEVILDAALRQEIWLPHACRGGSCGSCRAIVIAGVITYGSATPGATKQVAAGPANAPTVALLCRAKPLGDVVLDVAELPARPIAATFRRPARVIDIVKPSRDVAVLTVRPPPAAAIEFRPGQYICLIGDDGRRHPFSIANAPRADGTLELHIGRVPNGRFTALVHERMRPRDIVRFEGPFGDLRFADDSGRPAILVAGGTGIAPLKAILESASTRPPRELHLYWGSRRPEGLYFIAQISVAPGVRVIGVVSEPTDPSDWRGRIGLVHRAVIEDFPDLSRFDVYACGSPGLIDAAFRDFTLRAGLPSDRFFADAFHHAGTIPQLASAAG
ncbi:MAG TPA: 2Fe-2S iron-sulfur cluster-binding protein [Xanthobacteraceae bacterium]|jgi:CDP-4-dehydro-6-deoxyglucose reductase